jgi:aspartate aminotransferase
MMENALTSKTAANAAHTGTLQTASTTIAIASRMARLKISPTMAVAQKARRMRQEGRNIIDLSIGEPDFDTPLDIQKEASAAIARGETRYTAPDGTPVLKAAIVEKFKRENDVSFKPSEIHVGAGAKQVIYNAFVATVDEGDEVIIPAPCWVSYCDMIDLVGGKSVLVPCTVADGLKLTPAKLRAAITPRTKWLLLNSPGNPSGAVYSHAELTALADVLREFPRVAIMTDEVYEHLVFDGGRHVMLAAIAPDLRNRILTVNGVSKTYCMTGWRIGYAAGPENVIQAMAKVVSQSAGNACSVSQAAAVRALTGPQDLVAKNQAIFQRRRDLVLNGLSQAPGLELAPVSGAFYVFPGIASLIGKKTPKGRVIDSDLTFCDFVLEDHGVAIVAGEAFGLSPYFRIAYAMSDELLVDACSRIVEACRSLR